MRRAFTTALVLLLTMLCLVDICLWLRGYSTGDSLSYYWRHKPGGCRFIVFQTAGGGVRIIYVELSGASVHDRELWLPGFEHDLLDTKYPYIRSTDSNGFGGLGFQFWREDRSNARVNDGPYTEWHRKYITFPHAVVVLILALYPLRFAWKIRRRRKRAKLGLCPRCGYDLRASQGPCPECGYLRVVKKERQKSVN
jgi:hypothetical protein